MPVWLAHSLLLALPLGPVGSRQRIQVTSTWDGTPQPSYLILPPGLTPNSPPAPLLVSLHTWSFDLEQRQPELEQAASSLGWIYLFPNFRGRNDHPDACGSAAAQQDILDAVEWVSERYPVDRARIYLTGVSGGGHMALLVAGRHPEVWAAVSAWVAISDLAAWHDRHRDDEYGRDLRACCGGAPGDSDAVDAEYRARSPLTWLHRATALPLDIAAGVHDGHRGSVPVRHSIEAYNAVATALGEAPVSEAEIAQISRPNGRLEQPLPGDELDDPVFGRRVYLRRLTGECRLSIFEGGHEGLCSAVIAFLAPRCKAID